MAGKRKTNGFIAVIRFVKQGVVSRVKFWGRHALDFVLLLACYAVCVRRRTSREKEIAIVRMDAIGDFILWIDAAMELRRKYDRVHYRLTIVANDVWADFAGQLGLFDAVISLNRRKLRDNPLYAWSALSHIRKLGFKTIIHPTYSRDFYYSDVIVRASGAVNRLGYSGDQGNMRPWEKRLSDRWYTQLIVGSQEPRMELIRNAEFMRGLGHADFTAKIPQLMVTHNLQLNFEDRDYFIIFPGAGWAGRRWAWGNFAEIARRVYEASGWMPVVCGGKEEIETNRKILDELGNLAQDWTGRTSLAELVAVIAKAQLVISNETSAIHVAAVTNRPSVCIVGGGHYGRFVPYAVEDSSTGTMPLSVADKMDCFHCNWRCIYSVAQDQACPCIVNVSIEDVWTAVQQWLPSKRPDRSY